MQDKRIQNFRENIKYVLKLVDFQFLNNKKDSLLIGYYDMYIEHAFSILILIENNLIGSAFTLIRPSFEAFIRGHYSTILNENQIKRFENGKNTFPSMGKMTQKIDELFCEEINYFQIIKKNGWVAMNDYTHGGMRQILRRFDNEGDLINTYTNEEIDEVLNNLEIQFLLFSYTIAHYFKCNKKDKIRNLLIEKV